MSEENVATARNGLEQFSAFMRGELSTEAFASLYDPQVDVRWHGEQTYPDTPQHLHGLDEVISFTEQYRAGWTDVNTEPLELSEVPGDRVLCFIRQSARGRQSGVPIEIHYYTLWTFRDGKVTQAEYFRHRADALGAAGLSE